MSGYLYFTNNLKDIDHIQAYMISSNTFFPINGNSFQRKRKFIATLHILQQYQVCIRNSISEQIAENRFRALLEISNKFITKFNVFSYMVLQFKLKTVWKILKPYCVTLETGQLVLLERSQFVPQKLGMKRFEIGKDMKIRQCLLSPYKVWGNFFRKKVLHGGRSVFGQIYGEMFYVGTNDQIMQGGS